MWKRLALAVVAVGPMVLGSGCASIQVAQKFNDQQITTDSAAPVAHIHGNTWGFYLLPIVPLLTGDTVSPGNIAVGKDTVTVGSAVDMVTAKSKALGATKTTDLCSSTSSLPVVPPIIWLKSVHVSGNATR